MRNLIFIYLLYTLCFIVSVYGQRDKLYTNVYKLQQQDPRAVKIDTTMQKTKRSPEQEREYKKRRQLQTISWANGKPYHNITDNECTPDFSCCNPTLLACSGERLIFLEAVITNNTACIEKMCFEFMERLANLKQMPAPYLQIKKDNTNQ